MEAFMELFGEYEILGLTVYKWGLLIVALIFVWKTGGKIVKRIKELLDAYQKREEELQKALQQVVQYPKWRQQSIEIQEKINNQLSELSKHQAETSQKIDKMEEDRKAGELNKLQAQLLNSYHYYTGAMDATCGNNLDSAIEKFQRAKNLTPDKCCGPDTWYALFN